MSPPWEIIFFGTPSFAVPALKGLLEGPDQVVAVVTQPDRRKGRGQKVSGSPVKELAVQRRLTVIQPESVKDPAFQEQIRAAHSDLFAVVAYGQILPKSLLTIPKHGAVNVHASLLPKYRGAAPIPWVILKGEETTGVTTMMMDEGMDTGDILLQERTPIEERETGESLHDRLSLLGAQLLRKTVEGMKSGTICPTSQDHCQATYAPSIKKDVGYINWKKEAREIDRQVRALNPWPGAFTRWDEKLLKICRGEARGGRPGGNPGAIVWVGSDFVEVETGRDSFLIQEVQLEGGKRMGMREFLSGHPIPVGTTFA